MKRLKEDVLKLSKAEQYEIYKALEADLFGEKEPLAKQQVTVINGRMKIVSSGKGQYMSPEQLRRELNNMIG